MKRAALFAGLWSALLWITVLGVRRQVNRDPDVRWPLPSFSMTRVTEKGTEPLTLSDLSGQPWMAGFIYTHCGGPCPMVSSKMAEIQKAAPPSLRLVSFSVDPDRDTPEALRQYARRFHADPKRWIFVQGKKEDLYKLMNEGFRLSLVEDSKAPDGFRVTHSTKLALVDSNGILRRLYDLNTEALPDRIRRDLDALEKEKAS